MSYVNSQGNVAVCPDEAALESVLNDATLIGSWGIGVKRGRFVLADEQSDGEIISAEAQAVLDRLPGLTATERTAIITFVNAESASLGNGNWALIDEFFCFALNSGTANTLIGFIAKTATNNGATFDINGATFAGAQDINTNWIPSVDGVNYQLEDAMYGIFAKSFSGAEGGVGAIDANRSFQQVVVGDLRGYVNALGYTTLTGVYQNNSLYIMERVASNNQRYVVNGVNQTINATIPSGIPATPMYVGQIGNASNYYTGAISTFIVGSAVGFNQAAHYNNHLEFLIELGVFATPVLDRFTALTGTETTAITNFVNQEVRAGNWGLYDEFFCFALAGANALIGFKSKTATNNGATFDINGATFNGTNAFIDSNFNPSTDGVNYLQDNAMHGGFLLTAPIVDSTMIWGAAESGETNYLYNLAGNIRFSVNNIATQSTASGQQLANSSLYCATRTGAGAEGNLYENAVPIGGITNASALPPSVNYYIGARNFGGATSFAACTIPSFILGAAIGFNQAAHNTNLRAFLTELGTLP